MFYIFAARRSSNIVARLLGAAAPCRGSFVCCWAASRLGGRRDPQRWVTSSAALPPPRLQDKPPVSPVSPVQPLQQFNTTHWHEIMRLPIAKQLAVYGALTKIRLSSMVVLTAMVGYAMAPGVLHGSTLLWTTLGTGLCVSAANTFNQWAEVPFDAQMKRTQVRPLISGVVTPAHAAAFGTMTGVAGVAMLATLVNPLVAALGASNIVLYAFIYTPLKRITIANTWVGALVGALPPMMGWAAATGGLEPGAWILAGVLFAWQFPHFNGLSWNLRGDYSRAGYRMMSVVDPGLCTRTSLRYSAAMVPLTLLAPHLDLTTWLFAVDGTLINAALLGLAWRFYARPDDESARRLFLFSNIHLCVLLIAMMLHKKNRPVAPLHEDPVSKCHDGIMEATDTILN